MKRVYIEFYERIGNVTFYTVRLNDNQDSETHAFLYRYRSLGYFQDLRYIKDWLARIGRRGADERFFRPERNVSAGPDSMSMLRVYCIRCGAHIVILGGGGVKKGRTTQDGDETKKAMDMMISIDRCLIKCIRDGEIWYSEDLKELKGNLIIEL